MAVAPTRHITTVNLVVVCFFWTIGGFYGTEGVLATGPPVVVLSVCCLLPLLYSLPTALISVELATMFPETTGGQCDYVRRVTGPRLGAHNTYWVWITTVIDSALYPQFVAAALQQEFGLDEPFRRWLPMGIVVLMAGVNMAGIDWLLRFELILGAITMVPCLLLLGMGLPQIRGEPLLEQEGEFRFSTMISWALWLYGGFTNIGVLSGEALTPRRSYLWAIAILVPMKLFLRFTPFVIAFSLAERGPEGPGQDQFGEGYFQRMAEQVGGRWLSIAYLVGAQISFVGFYNAMILGAERTACFFCEGEHSEAPATAAVAASAAAAADAKVSAAANSSGSLDGNSMGAKDGSGSGGRCGKIFDQWGRCGPVARFFFRLPEHGVRRIYCLVIATMELGLVLVGAPNHIPVATALLLTCVGVHARLHGRVPSQTRIYWWSSRC